jgi:hypothetical protein
MENAGKGCEVVLTADHTLMSDYHHNEFVGFGTYAPPNFIPDWLYSWLFFPPIKTENGVPVAAPYGLRKIEAQLLKDKDWFKEMNQLHVELLIKCLKHDFYWIDNIIGLAFKRRYAKLLRPFYRLFVEVIRYKAKKAGIK